MAIKFGEKYLTKHLSLKEIEYYGYPIGFLGLSEEERAFCRYCEKLQWAISREISGDRCVRIVDKDGKVKPIKDLKDKARQDGAIQMLRASLEREVLNCIENGDKGLQVVRLQDKLDGLDGGVSFSILADFILLQYGYKREIYSTIDRKSEFDAIGYPFGVSEKLVECEPVDINKLIESIDRKNEAEI